MRPAANEGELPTDRGHWPVLQPARSRSFPGEPRQPSLSRDPAIDLTESIQCWQACGLYLHEKLGKKEEGC